MTVQQTSDTASQAEVALHDAKDSDLQRRMLVVEDARCVQKALSVTLAGMNIEVDVAGDGVQACEMAEQSRTDGRPYDLILMDVQMPKMNGRVATQWLREHGWQGPIVTVTASLSEEERDQILKIGSNDCILKPATEPKLREVFSKHFGPKYC
jgi:CheY-like chemotaxis protein